MKRRRVAVEAGFPQVNKLHLLSEEERLNVAANPATPAVLLHRLVEQPCPAVLVTLARRQHHPRVLRRLSMDTDPAVRLAVASNPATPTDVLSMLAGDDDPHVRDALCTNGTIAGLFTAATDPTTSDDVLATIAAEPFTEMRRRVAGNPSAPANVVLKLAHDSSPHVRFAVASHPRMPLLGLLRLADDPLEYVCVVARERLDKWEVADDGEDAEGTEPPLTVAV